MKSRALWLTTTAVLALSWLALALILIQSHASWPIYTFVGISIILGAINLYIHYNSLPAKKIRHIETLAQQIDKRDANRVDELPLSDHPQEIRPLVEALNAFFRLEKDRIEQEHAFSAEASHELRSPLTGMRLQAQIAQRTNDPKQREKALNNVLKAVDRSTHLVEQLLTLSRLTRRYQDTQLEHLELSKVSGPLIAEYQARAQNSNIVLEHIVDARLSAILSCELYMTTLLRNLLDNALRHTPADGVIRVAFQQQEQAVSLVVEDSGPGIPPEQYEVVLAPFQKALDGQKRGSGLGLAIVKRIAEIHSSGINLRSSALGGLAVTVELPVAH